MTIITRSDGSQTISREALLSLPPELSDAPRLEAYLRIATPGWSKHEFGYWNYARLHENGDLYVYPALIIAGEPKPRRRFPNYTVEFSRRQIEDYAEQVEAVNLDYQRQVTEDFNLLVHDLRQLSTSIHHAAEEAFGWLEQGRFDQVNLRLQNIVGAQSMLRIRTDVLDYSGNAEHFTDMEAVPIYKKIDKVIRCFSAYAATKAIAIHLEGASFGRSLGPDVFEIVPYVLLDNAIKYSPRGNDIVVHVQERGRRIEMTVKSVGPLIEPKEARKIFERGVRGDHARRSGVPGSGAGLFVAKRVVDQFRGEIEASTSGSLFIINDIQMTDVTFAVSVPVTN